MNELIKVTYDNDRATVSGRELHEKLEIKTEYRHWFPRMCEYGFVEGVDFNPVIFDRLEMAGDREVKRTVTDHQMTIEMAKQICMIQHIDPAEAIRKIRRCVCDTPSIGWGDHLADYIDFEMGRITTEEFRRNVGIE